MVCAQRHALRVCVSGHNQVTARRGRLTYYTYLPGRVTVVADEDGTRANTWVHDDRGRLVRVTDSDGRSQRSGWDRWGNQVMVVERDGGRTARLFDDRGRLTLEQGPTGARAESVWDERDRLTQVRLTPAARSGRTGGPRDARGRDAVSVTRYEYEGEDRNPSVITDPEGGVTRLWWDGSLLTRLEDPTGVTVSLAYDAHGDLTSVTDAAGGVHRLVRDEAGRIVSAVTPLGHATSFRYDDSGLCVSRTDPEGGVWRMEYTAAGRLAASVDPLGGRTEVTYDSAGQEACTVDELGRELRQTWDDLGNLASVTLPDGSHWDLGHDALSRLTSVRDASGGRWSIRYDSQGRIRSTTDAVGTTRHVTREEGGAPSLLSDPLGAWESTYDGLGRPVGLRTPAGTGEDVTYDRCGRVLTATDVTGATTSYAYDAAGRLIHVTLPGGDSYGYEYDALGRWCATVSTAGARYEVSYDADSRLTGERWPTGERVTTEFDACGRPVCRREPGAGTRHLTYDRAGRVVRTQDTQFGTRRFRYDAAGQLVGVVNALGGLTTLEYDGNGRVVAQVDPAGGVTRYEHDGMGRVVSVTDPLGRVTRLTYDAAGRLTRRLEPTGEAVLWERDPAGRVVSEVLATAGGSRRTRRSVLYDVAGRQVSVSSGPAPGAGEDGPAAGTTRQVWDARGFLTESWVGTERTTWTYDEAGRRTSMTRPDGVGTTYEYDAEWRLAALVTDAGAGAGAGRVSVERDLIGRSVSAHAPGLYVSWTWEDGYLAREETRREGARSVTVFERDDQGRVLARTTNGVTTRFGYDAAGQLTHLVGPDGVGTTYTWDAAGRLLRETSTGADGLGSSTVEYTYDAAGQLVTRTDALGTTRYTYDLLGRRTREEGPAGECRYSWNTDGELTRVVRVHREGDRRRAERAWDIERDASGTVTSVGEVPLTWDAASGATAPVTVGALSLDTTSGVSMTSGPAGAGARAWPTWSAWDVPTEGAGTGRTGAGPGAEGDGARPGPSGGGGRAAQIGDPWAQVGAASLGEDLVLETSGALGLDGLSLMGARVYDTATRSFLTTDPLLAPPGAAWGPNPYSFAGNDPVNLADPTGMAPVSDEQLRAYNQAYSGMLASAWDAATSWVADNWQYVAAAAVVVAGVAMVATGVGAGVGASILVGAASSGVFSAGSQYITTGHIDWRQVALDTAIGGASGAAGGGAAAGLTRATARTSMSCMGRNILVGAAEEAADNGVSNALNYLTGPGPHTLGGLASSTGEGLLEGTISGGAGGALAKVTGTSDIGCFVAGTPVVMADGSRKPIEQVTVGEEVLAHNPATGSEEPRVVVEALVHEEVGTWRVSTSDGGSVTTTATHPFLVEDGGWVAARDLRPGDRLHRAIPGAGGTPEERGTPGAAAPDGAPDVAASDGAPDVAASDGAPVTVVSVVPTGQEATVHNLHVAGLHSYYVVTTSGTPVAVHNKCVDAPGGGLIDYGSVDSIGRRSGIEAYLTPAMVGTGSRPNSDIVPPGYLKGGVFARGHLLVKQLGGSGNVESNLVTLFQNPVNHPIMIGFEKDVRRLLEAGEDVLYSSKPIYRGNSAVPEAVSITAESSSGKTLSIFIPNHR